MPPCAPAAARVPPSPPCSPRSPSAEDGLEQPREAPVEVFAPEPVHDRGPGRELLDHAALAQHPEVMGTGRLGDGQLERPAAHLTSGLGRERADDLQPHRIGERVQDAGQLERLGWRMLQNSWHDLFRLYDAHRTSGTMIVVLSEDRRPMSTPSSPPKRPPFRRVVVFTGRPN